MKRLDPELSEDDISRLGGKVGPRKPGERLGARRTTLVDILPIRVPRENHLPKRRPLFSLQRTPPKV